MQAPMEFTRPLRRPGMVQAFRSQMRVIDALIIREIYTRFGRENIGFLWIIVEPAMFCLAVIVLWSLVQHGGHTEIAIIPFLITGYMPLTLYRHLVGRIMRTMQVNSSLLFHRQINVFSLYAARIFVEVLATSAAFASCMILFIVLGYVELPDSIHLMIGGWFLYAWYSGASALIIGTLSERSETIEKIWAPFSYIQIPISGTFFMLYWMPEPFRTMLTYFPPINGVEMIRDGYFDQSIPTFYSATYFAGVNIVLTVIGLYFCKDTRRYVEVE